jgi:uncharacterized membrane protein YfcA
MQLYLPVAEMSANILVFLAMGGAVGFLSGMFGVGGGFLMTPLLIVAGIPAVVAVGTETAQILASSVSGALAQWRRRNVDVKMGLVLLSGVSSARRSAFNSSLSCAGSACSMCSSRPAM